MGVLDPRNQHYTLINIFTPAAGRRQALYDEIVSITDLVGGFPGFVSANVHLAESDERVVNYVQWRTEADFVAMTAHPVVQDHFRRCREISTCESVVCDLEYVHEGQR